MRVYVYSCKKIVRVRVSREKFETFFRKVIHVWTYYIVETIYNRTKKNVMETDFKNLKLFYEL